MVFAQASLERYRADFSKFNGIGQQVKQNLPQAQRVTQTEAGQIGRRFQNQHQPFGRRWLTHQLQGFAENSRQFDAGRFQLEHPGFHLGEIQNVIDQAEQQLAGTVDLGESLMRLAAVFGGAQADEGHAEDAIERRTDFVAHVGEEFALGFCQPFGIGAGQFEIGRTFADQLFKVIAIALDFRILARVLIQRLAQFTFHCLGFGNVGNKAVPGNCVISAALWYGIDQQPFDLAAGMIDPVLDPPACEPLSRLIQ